MWSAKKSPTSSEEPAVAAPTEEPMWSAPTEKSLMKLEELSLDGIDEDTFNKTRSRIIKSARAKKQEFPLSGMKRGLPISTLLVWPLVNFIGGSMVRSIKRSLPYPLRRSLWRP